VSGGDGEEFEQPDVRITSDAEAYIAGHGGSLFVYAIPAGGFSMVRWSRDRPDDRAFWRFPGRSCSVYVENGLWLGRWLEIRLRRFPRTGLDLDWPGRSSAT
jgi:hypothetical protein